MTKLRRKLQQMAKKRAHRKVVQKRKLERNQKELMAKQQEAERQKEEMAEGEMIRVTDSSTVRTTSAALTTSEKQLVGGLALDAGPAVKKGARKQLSRKQLKRKHKNIEKGEAIADQLEKKWNRKKMCVKVRAQVRNADLHN